MTLTRKIVLPVLLAFLAFQSASASAKDYEKARALLEKGEILSLTDIISKISDKVPGKLLEVELKEKESLIVYEIEYLGENGVVMEMLIDARTADIISIQED